jgi:hypothetical protein
MEAGGPRQHLSDAHKGNASLTTVRAVVGSGVIFRCGAVPSDQPGEFGELAARSSHA